MDHIEADPGILRALAHPLRGALLYELHARGSANATVLARAVDAPVNSVSFHLRQLARFGLIEEVAGQSPDARQRWWKPASREGIRVSRETLSDVPGGEAAIEVFRRNAVAVWTRLVNRFFSDHSDPKQVWRSNDVPLLLTPDEARELGDELAAVLGRWLARSQQHAPDSGQTDHPTQPGQSGQPDQPDQPDQSERETYLAMTMLMPRRPSD